MGGGGAEGGGGRSGAGTGAATSLWLASHRPLSIFPFNVLDKLLVLLRSVPERVGRKILRD